KFYEKAGQSSRLAFHRDIPVMFGDDLFHDRESETGASPVFCGEERVENHVELVSGDPAAAIAKLDFNLISNELRVHNQGSATGHRVEAVVDEVDENLL